MHVKFSFVCVIRICVWFHGRQILCIAIVHSWAWWYGDRNVNSHDVCAWSDEWKFHFPTSSFTPSLCVCSQYYMLCDRIGNIMTGFQFSLCFFFCEMKHQSEWKYEKFSYATSHAHVDDFPRIIPSRVGAPVFLSTFIFCCCLTVALSEQCYLVSGIENLNAIICKNEIEICSHLYSFYHLCRWCKKS